MSVFSNVWRFSSNSAVNGPKVEGLLLFYPLSYTFEVMAKTTYRQREFAIFCELTKINLKSRDYTGSAKVWKRWRCLGWTPGSLFDRWKRTGMKEMIFNQNTNLNLFFKKPGNFIIHTNKAWKKQNATGKKKQQESIFIRQLIRLGNHTKREAMGCNAIDLLS